MHHSITRNDIAAGYLVAGLTLCLGVYFGLKVEGDIGTTLVRGFYLLAVCVVLKFTFAWASHPRVPGAWGKRLPRPFERGAESRHVSHRLGRALPPHVPVHTGGI